MFPLLQIEEDEIWEFQYICAHKLLLFFWNFTQTSFAESFHISNCSLQHTAYVPCFPPIAGSDCSLKGNRWTSKAKTAGPKMRSITRSLMGQLQNEDWGEFKMTINRGRLVRAEQNTLNKKKWLLYYWYRLVAACK